MRKGTLLIVILSFALALSGCANAAGPVSGTTPTPGATEGPLTVDAQKDTIKIMSYSNVSAGNGLLQSGQAATYVGLGYNVLESTYINPESFTLGRHILQEAEVKKKLKTKNAPSQKSYTITGETMKSYPGA